MFSTDGSIQTLDRLGADKTDGTQRNIQNKNGDKSKDYNPSFRSYLQKRCKTYKQNSFNYNLNGTTARPNCIDPSCTVVYKRSNTNFSQQGAVSSGSLIHRLKYNTILKNEKKYIGGQTQNKDVNVNVPCMLNFRMYRKCS